ncbi:MAG: lysozyme [Oscillospiraceae bacterium]|nr:lysozyme [Oscillospiraceae bacterium]
MLRTSERGIAFIKDHEGFVTYKIWDYKQYSIGYGSHCGVADYPNGITKEQGDKLLRQILETETEPIVAKVERTRGKKFLQCEWDALTSLTYNLGAQWVSPQYSVYKFATGEYQMDEAAFIATMQAWCHAGGDKLEGLERRRTQEARLYLYGDYSDGKPFNKNENGKEESIMYPKLKDVPEWAHDEVKALIDAGIVLGTQGEGEDRQIDMTHSECRCCVWMVRYAEELIKNVPGVAAKDVVKAIAEKFGF